MLEPMAIAVWYMDDGCLYYNGNICHLILAVDNFNDEEIQLIINYFKTKFDINFKQSRKQIRLTSIKEVVKFESFFKESYHHSMLYKTLDFKKLEHKQNKTK
jgi:mannitol/fructose-specific phosphotransferase system IIA component